MCVRDLRACANNNVMYVEFLSLLIEPAEPNKAFGFGLGLLLAGVISALTTTAGVIYTNRQNRRNQERALQQQKELMDKEQQMNRADQERTYRLYNSPIAQRKSQENAGLNPFVQGANIQNFSASSPEVSAGSPPDFAPTQNPLEGFQTFANQFSSIAGVKQQEDLVDAQVKKTNAETNKALLEGELLQNAVDMKEYTNMVLKEGALGAKLKNKFQRLQNDIAEIESKYVGAERAAKIAELWSQNEANLAQAAKTREEKEIVSKMSKYVEAKEQSQIDLNTANAKLAGAQASGVSLDTEIKESVRESIEAQEWAKLRLGVAEAQLAEGKVEAIEIENELNDWLKTQKIERKPHEDWYTITKEIFDRYVNYKTMNIKSEEAKNAQRSRLNQNNTLILGLILRYFMAKG